MKKKYQAKYEEIAKIDEPHYLSLWKLFSKKGDQIPNGVKIKPTIWAIENGVIKESDNREYIKIRNHRSVPHSIVVQRLGNKQPAYYWSGFWQKA